jgi:hypothetical protein
MRLPWSRRHAGGYAFVMPDGTPTAARRSLHFDQIDDALAEVSTERRNAGWSAISSVIKTLGREAQVEAASRHFSECKRRDAASTRATDAPAQKKYNLDSNLFVGADCAIIEEQGFHAQ